ncbi:hypothetical protein C4D60_Mb07t14990 [Musa balbisiana]|uniref:Transposase (putative) gypsy type domain-containing protein n=1 Tax=Musa balbisiana TaxID=52838 RepID=A0A4V4H6N6_MUSBA|nr:hypothetical protein C4D60_Mb07t14990 [Musa balbisiana]
MASTSSSFLLSSPSTSGNVGEKTLPPSPNSSSDEKEARAIETLMWPQDLDSTVSESLLDKLRDRFRILEEFILLALELGQRAYDSIPKGFALTLDSLEARLRFPLHPVISSCISWWRISPSQMVPNSWCYLVAFLGECHYANITPTRSLFLSCFRLSKGSRGYYLSARSSFRVSEAPFSNKGWNGRFFYVCCAEGWSFELRWATRVIDNTAPSLNDEERRDLRRLKEILPASRVIRNMTEQWLVEAGLSPSPREMVNLVAVRGGRASPAISSHRPTERRIDSKDAPVELEAGRPQKKAKTGVKKKSNTPVAQPGGTVVVPTVRDRRESLSRGEAGPSKVEAGKAPREPSIRELCCLPAGAHGEPYQARAMGELPEG